MIRPLTRVFLERKSIAGESQVNIIRDSYHVAYDRAIRGRPYLYNTITGKVGLDSLESLEFESALCFPSPCGHTIGGAGSTLLLS